MKEFFKFIKSDKIIYFGFITSGILLFIAIVGVLALFQILPPFLPIYNKLPWGYARIGAKIELFIPIGIATSIFIFNSFLSKYAYKKVLLLGRILAAITLLVSISLFIYILQIIILIH